MKLALIILFIVSQISLFCFCITNIFRLIKKSNFHTELLLLISALIVTIVSIPEIILYSLISQPYLYCILKLIVFAILLIANMFLVYKKYYQRNFKKQK